MINKIIEDKIKGTIYGMAIGDALGMPPELWGRKKIQEVFKKPITEFLDGQKDNEVSFHYTKGQFTDDTSQALLILDALIENNFKVDKKLIGQKMLEWAKKENAWELNILGPTTKVALKMLIDNQNPKKFTDKALSNGSAMRIAPIGLLFKPSQVKKLCDFVYEISSLTHTSDVTIAGACMVAMAVSSALVNDNFKVILKDIWKAYKYSITLGAETFAPNIYKRLKLGIKLANTYKNNSDLFSKQIYEIVGAGVGIVESVPAAISIAYYCQNVEQAALMCANLGGDTDTIGAMATSICGALTGAKNIRKDWIKTIHDNNDFDIDKYINGVIKYKQEGEF